MPLICERCHEPTRKVTQVPSGEHKGDLWCKKCYLAWEYEGVELHHHAAFRDEIPGGIELENYGAQPMTFYSHSERRAYMARAGLREKETFCPLPGTDVDPAGIPNPEGYVDDYTRKSREELYLRAHTAEPRDPDENVEPIIGETYSGHLTEQDAVAIGSGDKRRQSRLGRRLHAEKG